MPTAYLMGGFFESDLGYVSGGLGVAWLDITKLVLGSFGEMRLAANGIDPGPPDGVALRSAGPLTPYVLLPGAILAAQLAGDGYRVGFFGWDWRKEMYAAGVLLAQRIRNEVSADDPCTLVGHSAGGLVARAAWMELVMSSQSNLVRRIITLGTPHWGSYSHVGVWSGVSEQLDQIIQLNHIVGYPASLAPWITGYIRWERNDVVVLTQTWPCLYELLPVVGAPDSGDDPFRESLFTNTNWPASARPRQSWLDYARGPWRDFLMNPASTPPSNVLTCVSGRGYSTFNRLRDPDQLGDVDALGSTNSGDGTVTQGSAELGGAIYEVTCDHPNLMPNLVNDGRLREWILAERAPPPTPPPPVVVIPEPMPITLPGPPLETVVILGEMSLECSLRTCNC